MFDKYKDQEIELLDEDFDSNDDVEDIDLELDDLRKLDLKIKFKKLSI